MTVETIITALAMPQGVRVDQRVPKKLLLESGAPTSGDKRKIQEGIAELFWIAALKPTTIGVSAYRDDTREYLEIAVLSVDFRTGANASRLTELIHRAIPYPVFLIQTQQASLMLSLAHLRWSQGQSGQAVLDGPLVTAVLDAEEPATEDFLASLSLAAQPRQHLHALYQGWIERFEAFAAAKITKSFTLCESPVAYQTRREALAEYGRLAWEVFMLRARTTKETQINRRVEMNIELKRLEAQLADAVGKL